MLLKRVLSIVLVFSLLSCNKGQLQVDGVSYERTEKYDVAHILVDPSNVNGPKITIPILPNWVSKQRTETSEHYVIILQDDKYPKGNTPTFVSILIPKGEFLNTKQGLLNTAKSTYDSFASAYKIINSSNGFSENDINSNYSVEFWFMNTEPVNPELKDLNFTMVLSPVKDVSEKCGPVIISYTATGIEDMSMLEQMLEANIPIFRKVFSHTSFENF